MITKFLFFLLTIPLLICCNGGGEDNIQTSSVRQFENIVALLDLSDRITQPNQIARDKQLLESIISEFEKRQKKFGFIASKDKFSIAIASQRDNELNLSKYKDSLFIDMSTSGMNKPLFDLAKRAIFRCIDSIYSEALRSKTTGADIWTFFRDNATNYLSLSSPQVRYHNKFIILTDGYLVFDNEISSKRATRTFMSQSDIQSLRNKQNWENLFERKRLRLRTHENQNYENLQVLMLEIQPRDPQVNTNEFKILEKYWKSWFDDMGIESTIQLRDDNISTTKNAIGEFVKKKT